jgi:hypothetical protein
VGLEVHCWSEDLINSCLLYILKAIHSPTSPPNPLKNNDVKDNISAPHSSGIAPPIVEPIKIATQIEARDGMTTPCMMFKHEGRGRGNGATI